METLYKIIRNYKELDQLIQACKETGYACVDFETNGEGIYTDTFKPTLLSVSFQPSMGCAIPLNHFETAQYTDAGWDWKRALLHFGRTIIENPNVVKMGWNLKFDFQIFDLYGIWFRGTVIDGMLAKYMLNEVKPHGLKDMVRRYLPDKGDYEKADAFDRIPWAEKKLEPLSNYGCQDTDYTFRLCIFFEKRMIDIGIYSTFRNLIMPSSRVLQHAERNGLYINKEFNTQLVQEYKPKIDECYNNILQLPKVKKFTKLINQTRVEEYVNQLKKEISSLRQSGGSSRSIESREQKISNIRNNIFTTNKEKDLVRGINLNSNKDLPQLLYSKEGFHFDVIKKTEKGVPSTDEETLLKLKMGLLQDESDAEYLEHNPKAIFLENLLKLRGLEKMYKTYIVGWNEKIQSDSKLHGRYNIHGTESGRLSSADPNIQQIPKTSVDPNIKKQLEARPGTLYFESDFSQAELRIMAHLSGDETYLEAFSEGMDPHLAIAARKYGVPYPEALGMYKDEDHPDHSIWSVRRKQAKQIAFGLIYGIGAGLLAEKLSDTKSGLIVTKAEAQKEMDIFFKDHPKLKSFKNKQEKRLIKLGYLKSLFNRRRRLPEVYSDDPQEVAYAVRLALNFPCQSAASDMTLFGSILIYWLMRQGKLPFMWEVATVHDAVYYNALPEDINVYTVNKMWNIFKNPETKPYFGFQIEDVTMDMDYSVGRTMAEELPFIPGYDYRNMLKSDFSVEEYMALHKEYKDIEIKDYPSKFPDLMTKLNKHYNK